jgi:hypothetical protein
MSNLQLFWIFLLIVKVYSGLISSNYTFATNPTWGFEVSPITGSLSAALFFDGNHLNLQLFSSNGTIIGSNKLIQGDNAVFTMTSLNLNSTFLVVYWNGVALNGILFDQNGNQVSGTFLIVDESLSNNVLAVDAAVLSNGSFVVTWLNSGMSYVRVILSNCSTPFDKIQVFTQPIQGYSYSYLQVEAFEDSGFVVANVNNTSNIGF